MSKKNTSLTLRPAAIQRVDPLKSPGPGLRSGIEQIGHRPQRAESLARIEARNCTENGLKSSVLDLFLGLDQPPDHFEADTRFSESSLMASLALASVTTLQDFRMSRLSSAANLQKDMRVIFGEIINELAEAKLAELLLHHAERNVRKTARTKGK